MLIILAHAGEEILFVAIPILLIWLLVSLRNRGTDDEPNETSEPGEPQG